jgi:quinol monooxygenase YgiN
MPPTVDSPVVTCSIEMRFLPNGVNDAVRLLVSAIEPTEATPACRKCSVARDAIEEGIVHYTEEWESEEAFQRHLQSEVFRRVLTAMDMCCEEPRVTVGKLTGRSGIAHLQELRERKR